MHGAAPPSRRVRTSAELRAQADRARRLAGALLDLNDAKILLTYAAELDAHANAVEASRPVASAS